VENISFGLLELEMADLECFLRKMALVLKELNPPSKMWDP
jgi:hypothetical protein